MSLTRRQALLQGAALVAAATPLAAQSLPPADEGDAMAAPATVKRRVSGFHTHDWREHFETLANGAILCDTEARVLFYWSEDESITRVFPTSVPLTDELTRRGRTEITLKRLGPEWRPTPEMLSRNPDLPKYVGPGPENPLGTHALNLGWPYYRIHGTNDERKIGRRSSNGCIGLYNKQIAELFELAKVGTQVVLI